MKKFINKLFLLCAIISLVVPSINVFAEEEGIGSSGSEPVIGEGNNQETDPSPSTTPVEKTKAVLESLEVAGYKFTESFSSDRTTYKLTVKSSVQSIVINATAKEGVSVVGGGSQNLSEGENEFKVVAKTTDSQETYTIKITRSTSDLSLKILSITGHPLNETFDPSVLDYTADVTYDTESVIVKAGTNNSDATQQISGNSNLKVGKNTVRIIVKNSSGEQQEYRIIVNRASEEEEKEEDDDTEDLSSEEVTSSLADSDISDDDSNKKSNTLKYVLVVIFCIILLVVAILGIYFYIRTGNSEKRKQKKIEKLKKKQAKIDQELTALLPVITEDMIDEGKEEIEEDTQKTKEYKDDEYGDTIELDDFLDEDEEEVDVPKAKKRVERNILEDFDDLFLDDEDE